MPSSTRRAITATYRLQMRGPAADESGAQRAFGFAEAESIVDYLADLGISHLYLSPIFTAPVDSSHGYNIIDPTEVNPELGGLEGLRKLSHKAKSKGLGIIIDIVPNHVGVEKPELNSWWWDVLKFGKDSEFEPFFDIDWHEDNGAGGKLGLPILGEPGDEEKLEFSEHNGEEVLTYFDHLFPIRPGTRGPEDSPLDVYRKQSYRLMFWRDGIISYRRFFSVNELAGIRQEDARVFEHTHGIIRQLIAEDLIDGVRVDHPDGLTDPFRYIRQLRDLVGPHRWLVIEKILGVDEPLDPRLPADGTTGYDALREFDGVFISREAEDSFSMLALQHTGSTWDDTAIRATEEQLKREVAKSELAAEVERLARAIRRDNFSTAGSSVSDQLLRDTIVELVAAIPVYRADYISLSRVTATVVSEMSRRFPSRRDALDLIVAALLANSEAKTRFAQVCGAVMAKGVEDTTFYRAARLVALQEVGGDPGRFGVPAAEFHLLQQERSTLWPLAMTTLSTHDTKRDEDVRARIIELTEMPNEFTEFIRRIFALAPAPDSATGYFLIQNLLGIWPVDGQVTDTIRTRFHNYILKAVREAGLHTSWVDNNTSYEQSLLDWCDNLIDGPAGSQITELVKVLHRGQVTISVGRKLLHIIGPGIPDIYQGTEFISDSLVDPDNRRFIDYTARAQTLGAMSGTLDAEVDLCASPDRYKQKVLTTGLRLRQRHPEIFLEGGYEAAFAEGPAESHVLGIARTHPDQEGPEAVSVIALATRRPLLLARREGWVDTTFTLPPGQWHEEITGEVFEGTVPMDRLLGTLPAALLVKSEFAAKNE
ncbi:malto-oligosyltrehalose synthase [Corynebacterium poyangense]|uniref:Malto-oligosyltrehalose synthase n=1 Tax=Corynebacterium poyangense TaxID=2684405 RepID=A0A7H0SPQ7_9CORY|nr:malto-oligosyltrehalose synthase [Corynebacterium poyangense]QNQ90532.1 malto-oligosyltrehalose synthase [Corynebacterium poyangense]